MHQPNIVQGMWAQGCQLLSKDILHCCPLDGDLILLAQTNLRLLDRHMHFCGDSGMDCYLQY